MGVTSLQGLTILVDDENGTWSLSKLKHIVAHTNHCAGYCGSVGLGKELRLVVGSRAQVDETIVVAILAGDGLKTVVDRMPPLQLTTPKTAEEAVDLTVVVLKYTGIDGERATDGSLLRNERALRLVGNGHTEVEHTVIALSGEDEVVLAILLDDVVVPHLLLCPLHLVDIKNHTVVGSFVVLNIIPRQHVIVAHLEVSAIIVEALASIPVMAGVDVQASVEHVGRWVSHIVTREQVTR